MTEGIGQVIGDLNYYCPGMGRYRKWAYRAQMFSNNYDTKKEGGGGRDVLIGTAVDLSVYRVVYLAGPIGALNTISSLYNTYVPKPPRPGVNNRLGLNPGRYNTLGLGLGGRTEMSSPEALLRAEGQNNVYERRQEARGMDLAFRSVAIGIEVGASFLKKVVLGHGIVDSLKRAFTEGVQQNGLVDSYNGGNPDSPIAEGGSAGGEIGGVGNKVAIIEGLFDKYRTVEESEHLFYIPTAEGKQPFTNEELQQILRELAIGIYAHDTVPFFSLHFTGNSDLYPVIHPAYQNTLVGRVIGMLDYYMKGFLNGGFFPEKFIHEWQTTKTHDPAILKAHLVDLHELCQNSLGHSYYSIREILDFLKENDEEPQSEESPLLSDYSGFRSSFRIIAKQKSIKQAENLFVLDGDFDVFYSIEPDPVYEEELKKHRCLYGCDPKGYVHLVSSYDTMKQQIKTLMPKLSPFRELFEMLNVINFFSYYFKTLKQAHKVPIFDTKVTNTTFCCPPLFPHLPVRKMARQDITFNWEDFFGGIPPENREQLNNFLRNVGIAREPPQEMVDRITQNFLVYLQGKVPFPLAQSPAAILSREKALQEILRKLIKEAKGSIVEGEKILLDQKTYEAKLRKCIVDMRAALDLRTQEQQELSKILPQLEAKLVALQHSLREIQQAQAENPIRIAQSYAQDVSQINQHYARQRAAVRQQHAQEIAKIDQEVGRLGANVNHTAVNTLKTQLNNQLNALLTQINQAEATGIAGATTRRDAAILQSNASCTVAITEVSKDIASIHEAIRSYKTAQAEIEKELNTLPNSIQLAEKELEDLIDTIQKNEHVFNNPLSISKGYKMMWTESDRLFTLFTELPEEERIEYKRIVGGCGLNLKTLPITLDPLGQQILDQSCPDLLEAGDEEMKPVSIGSEKKADGYIFRLHYADYNASKSKEYEWMQFLLQRETPKEPLKKAEAFSAIYHENSEAFSSVIKQPEVYVHDRDCRGVSLTHYAAASASSRYLAELISRGASLKIEDPMGYLPLHYAAKEGSIENVSLLLEHHLETLNQRAKNDATPLYLAVQHNQLNIVKYLIKKGADVNAQATHGMSPLYSAIHNGFDEIALELLNCKNIDVNLSLEDGTTPLYLASTLEKHLLVQRLLEKGADISRRRIDSYAPLHIVAKKGKEEMIRLLLQHPGLNINLPLKSGKTALHLAVEYNHHEITRILLEAGADTTHFGWDRETVLLTAIRSGNIIAAEYIIQFANQIQISHLEITYRLIDFPDVRNQTPLQAVLERRSFSVLEKLLKSGVVLPSPAEFVKDLCKTKADPLLIRSYSEGLQENQRAEAFYLSAKHGHNQMVSLFQLLDGVGDFCDEQGWTILHFAAKYDHLNVIQDFISTSPKDLIQTDKEGKTLAAIAAEHGSYRVLKLILQALQKKQISLHKQYKGNHLLLAAVEIGHQDCADLIIHNMIDFNVNIPLDHLGRHAAHIAAKNGDVEMLDFLRLRGARFELYDKEGKTPFHYAFASRWKDAIDYLLDKKHEFILPVDLLHFVAGVGTVKHIKKLLNRGYGVNAVAGPSKETPIFCAIRENNLSCISYLCQLGADIDIVSSEELTPKQLAAKQGLTLNQEGILGVQVTSEQEKEETVHERVRLGKKVDFSVVGLSSQDKYGVSLLHICAAFANLEELGAIWIHKCDVNIEDKKGCTPIYYAIEAKKYDNIKILLQSGANVNHMSHKRLSPLMFAVENELPFVIQLLLRHGAKVDQFCDTSKKTCLHRAVEKESIEIVKLLISHEADLNKADLFGIRPIHLAAKQGNYGLLRLLKGSGASLHEVDNQGQTVAHYAVLSKNPTLLDLLKEEGISFDQQTKISAPSLRPSQRQHEGLAPLHLAARKGNILMLKKLVEYGCRIEALDKTGFSALCFAALSGNKEAVRFFSDYRLMKNTDQRAYAIQLAILQDLSHQLKPLYQGDADQYLSSDGTTGLHLASSVGATRSSHYLIGVGANTQRTNVEGENAFELALKNKRLVQARFIAQKMEDFDIQKKIDGKTYLHLACEGGDIEMTSLLIQWGASLDETDAHGLTPLHYAAKQANYQLLRLLLVCGADITKKTPEGKSIIDFLENKGIHFRLFIDKYRKIRTKAEEQCESPLHLGVRMGDLGNLPLLLHTVDPEYPNQRGLTAFHLAAIRGNLSICRIFLDHGVDKESEDLLGRTPLFLAAVRGRNPKLVQFLLRAKANPQLEDKNEEVVLLAIARQPYEEYRVRIFDLLYEQMPKQEVEQPTAPMLSALKAKDIKGYFRCIQQGHPLKKPSFSLLHLSVTHGLAAALIANLAWFHMDPNQKDLNGYTPMDIAIRSNRMDLAGILLKHGAKTDANVQKQIEALAKLQHSIDGKIRGYDEGWGDKLSEIVARKGLKISIPPPEKPISQRMIPMSRIPLSIGAHSKVDKPTGDNK